MGEPTELAHRRYRYSLLVTIAPDQVRSARPDCSQSDCEHREDYKDCSSIAHGRTRSARELIFSAYNYEVDRTMIL